MSRLFGAPCIRSAPSSGQTESISKNTLIILTHFRRHCKLFFEINHVFPFPTRFSGKIRAKFTFSYRISKKNPLLPCRRSGRCLSFGRYSIAVFVCLRHGVAVFIGRHGLERRSGLLLHGILVPIGTLVVAHHGEVSHLVRSELSQDSLRQGDLIVHITPVSQ